MAPRFLDLSVRLGAIALLGALVGSCAYVTRAEYDALRDADGDGWPLDEDCDDNDPNVYPYAPDYRGDGCDADCGMEPDADGDDWPDKADCDPKDPDAHPCSNAEVPGDGIDHDCDGLDSVRTDACPTDDPDFPDTTAHQCGGGGT